MYNIKDYKKLMYNINDYKKPISNIKNYKNPITNMKQNLIKKGKKLVQKRLLPHYDGQVFSYGNSQL